MKIPLTPAGFEPAIFRFVTQHLKILVMTTSKILHLQLHIIAFIKNFETRRKSFGAFIFISLNFSTFLYLRKK